MAFVSKGYCNWKDATGVKGAFNKHEKSGTHKLAIEYLVTIPAIHQDIGAISSPMSR